MHNAIRGLKLDLTGRDELIVIAESFEDLINSYGGDPPPADMEEARLLLNKLVEALREALNRILKETL